MPTKTTVVQRAIPLSSPLEWKQALSGIPHSFFHTWEHSYAMHLTHKLPAFLYCAEADDVRVVCPFIERPFGEYIDIATPYGFSGFAGNGVLPSLPQLWREFATARGYVSVFLNTHPLFWQAEFSDPADVFELKELYLLDARGKVETLLEGCARARRRELRKWRAQATLHRDRAQLRRFILVHYRDFYHSRDATAAYNFSSETIEFLVEQDNLLLLGAGSETRLEAVNAFAVTDDCTEGLFHFSRPEGRRHSAGLMWEALLETKRRGIPFFNLGGGLARNDSLARFKSRFGALPLPCRAIRQVLNAERYAALCDRSGVNRHDHDEYFPRYRTPKRSDAIHV